MANSGRYDSIVSCVRLKKFRWSETATPLDYSFANKPRRQDYKGFLVESGSFYSASVRIVLSEPYILSGEVGIVEVDSELAIDIDEPRDWMEAEYIAANTILNYEIFIGSPTGCDAVWYCMPYHDMSPFWQ